VLGRDPFRGGHGFVACGVVVDEPVRDQRAQADREDEDDQHQHQLGAVLVLAHLPELVEDLPEGISERVDGVVGVVDRGEGVPPSHTQMRRSMLLRAVGTRPAVERDREAGE